MSEQNQNTPNAETPATEADATDTAAQPQATPSAEESITALEAEVAQLRDKWLRAEADMQNLRARSQREIQDARNFAVQRFARDVVEQADNLRRGLEALPPESPGEPELHGKLRGGFESLERAFLAMLERHGVTRQEAEGKPFDAELHQAMSEQPAPSGVAPGTVLQAYTPAWSLNGRLLKPAMVVVASGGVDTSA